jgi:hypothetical protein
MVGPWVLVVATALLALTSGCATTRSYRFVSAAACDYRRTGATPQSRAEAAILLVPEHVEVFVPGDGGLGERRLLDYRMNWHENYLGPARVFLMPGPHRYSVTVKTGAGAADFDLNLPVKAAERHLLQVSEQADTVAIRVLALSDDDYRALYPNPTAERECLE